MTDKPKIRIVVDEDTNVVAQLDLIADGEGISRADVLRRAIRRYLFSMTVVPTSENKPEAADIAA